LAWTGAARAPIGVKLNR